MRLLISVLKMLNFLLGALLIIGGFAAYFLLGAEIPLYLALGLIAVGPLESILVWATGQSPDDPSQYRALIDQATSLVLELFMLAAALPAILR